jgi:PhzF family phenazine biosynthesis protein
MRSLKQVDVFTSVPYLGNPVAVVVGADDINSEVMQAFANWTNLSETTFLLEPTDPSADYRVRIFTPGAELPFAGHPTIGTCHAWLEVGGVPKSEGKIIQECELGLIELRNDGRISFAAPDPIRSGPVDAHDIATAAAVLQLDPNEVVDAQWCDNGPGWMALLLKDGETVRNIECNFPAGKPEGIGVVGPHTLGVAGLGGAGGTDLEIRAFFSANGNPAEDPVTGSLNAAVAQWLLKAGHINGPYIAAQGTAIGRAGRIYINEADDEVWVGGDAITCIEGLVDL